MLNKRNRLLFTFSKSKQLFSIIFLIIAITVQNPASYFHYRAQHNKKIWGKHFVLIILFLRPILLMLNLSMRWRTWCSLVVMKYLVIVM